jgi:hypothetical protein
MLGMADKIRWRHCGAHAGRGGKSPEAPVPG